MIVSDDRRHIGARHRQTFAKAYLERIYPTPRPYLHHEDRQRFLHLDLEWLDDEALAREGRRAHHRADIDDDPISRVWFIEQVQAVDAEKRRRVDALHAERRRERGGR